MRSEFEKNRYWIGLYRSDVDFDETLGEFGRYVANGSRRFDAANLESFNEKWEVYANAWQHQQSKVDELTKQRDSFIKAYEIEMDKSIELQKRVDELESAFKHLIEMENKSISFERDLFDKGWNQSASQTIENIYKLTGLGEQALKGGEE